MQGQTCGAAACSLARGYLTLGSTAAVCASSMGMQACTRAVAYLNSRQEQRERETAASADDHSRLCATCLGRVLDVSRTCPASADGHTRRLAERSGAGSGSENWVKPSSSSFHLSRFSST